MFWPSACTDLVLGFLVGCEANNSNPQSCLALQKFLLRVTSVSKDSCQLLQLPSVSKLAWSRISFSDLQSPAELQGLLRAINKHPFIGWHIKDLVLSNEVHVEQYVQTATTVPTLQFINMPNLETLNLKGLQVLTDEDVILWLRPLSKIKEIVLTGQWRLSDKTLFALSSYCQALTCLKASSCTMLTHVGMAHVFQACNTLQVLNGVHVPLMKAEPCHSMVSQRVEVSSCIGLR